MATTRDHNDGDGLGGVGTGSGGRPVTVPPKWLDITWTFAEPDPVGLLSGFEVAVVNGATPGTSPWIIPPFPVAADARRATRSYAASVDLSNARGCVRGVYGSRKGPWSVQGVAQAISSPQTPIATSDDVAKAKIPTAVSDGVQVKFLYAGPLPLTCTDWQGEQPLSASARTNLTTNATVGGLAWNPASHQVVAGALTAPDGTTCTAIQATKTAPADASFNTSSFYSPKSYAIGEQTTLSVYWRQGTLPNGYLNIYAGQGDGTGGRLAKFLMTDGVVSVHSSDTQSSVQAGAGGWYRLIMPFTWTAAKNSCTPVFYINPATLVAGMQWGAWGCQAESGLVATRYIKTSGTARTVTDYALSGDVVTLGEAPVSGAILRGMASLSSRDIRIVQGTLDIMASDGWLSKGEKPKAVLEYDMLQAEAPGLIQAAIASSQNYINYQNALDDLQGYLQSLTPNWADATTDTPIDPLDWKGYWSTAYSERDALTNACTYVAQITANSAVGDLAKIASDNWLSRGEKPEAVKQWNDLVNTWGDLLDKATAAGVSNTTFHNAMLTLQNYLANLSPTWSDSATDTPIVGTTWKANWVAAFTERTKLINAIAEQVRKNAAYADDLARATYNLVKNGNSEMASPTGLEAAGVSSAAAFSGSKSRLVPAGAANVAAYLKVAEFPVAEGDQFYAESRVNSTANTSGWIDVTWRSATDTNLGSSTTNVNGSTAWDKTYGTVTAPAGAVKAQVFLASRSTDGLGGRGTYHDCIYVARKVGAGMLEADSVRTSNYTEDGSGYPTAGAKMDTAGIALKVASNSFQIGSQIFTDYWFRLANGIDGAFSGGFLVFRGNNDQTINSGVPLITSLDIQDFGTSQETTYGTKWVRFQFRITRQAQDNTDFLQTARCKLFWSGGGASPVDTFYVPLAQPIYRTAPPVHTDNTQWVDYTYMGKGTGTGSFYGASSPYRFAGHLLVSISNLYGWSSEKWFHSAATTGGWYSKDDTPPTGAPPPTGGSGSGGAGGGGCPAPWVRVMLASGLVVDAADLYDGAPVVGVDDQTLEPAVGVVRNPRIIFAQRVAVILADGQRPEFSQDHRLAVLGRGWVAVQDMRPGDQIMAQQPAIVERIERRGMGEVVTFQVEGCHTYFTDGLASHNAKAPIVQT